MATITMATDFTQVPFDIDQNRLNGRNSTEVFQRITILMRNSDFKRSSTLCFMRMAQKKSHEIRLEAVIEHSEKTNQRIAGRD